ncbi:MAG: phage holin family protein [Bacteroidetes bacterium]|nr:phage holin family protein [Bacteroidota bacterium]MBI3482276.1 phage holin family protein [Bacteroidota bacterium]
MDIKDSIFKFLRLDNLIKSLSGYVETRVELFKIEVREETIKVVSYGLMIGICFLLGLLFLIFLSIGFANYISTYYGTTFTGYWIVAGTYGLIFLIVILLRKNIGHFIEQHLKEQAKQKGK